MTPTDTQLKQALAKMLPERVEIDPSGESLFWKEEVSYEVLDTELLHLCWLVETSLDTGKRQTYRQALFHVCPKTAMKGYGNVICHATWQQRVTALAKVKGIEIV